MKKVNPIKDANLIKKIISDLSKETNHIWKRRYMLFVTGIYLGLRISDILKLRKYDVYDKGVLLIVEQKTRKTNEIPIPQPLQIIFKKRLKNLDNWELIFKSSHKKLGKPKAITRKTAYNDINATCKRFGFDGAVGCHTLRKTFGYAMYQKTKDFALIMDWLNHSDLNVTKRYIGLDLDSRQKAARDFKF